MRQSRDEDGQRPQISVRQRLRKAPVDHLDPITADQAYKLPQRAKAKMVQIQALGLQTRRFIDRRVTRAVIANKKGQEKLTPLLKSTGELEHLLVERRKSIRVHRNGVHYSPQTAGVLRRRRCLRLK